MDRPVRSFRFNPDRQAYRPLPFWATLRQWRDPVLRRMVLWWIGLSLVFIPTGMITRLLEWTGISVSLGGVDFFITVYIPLLYCTLCVMWLGYAWGAIPAYFATFFVALIGGMPLHWNLVFSFANPVGLAVYAIAFRAIPVRSDLRSVASFLFFTLTAFVAALVSSSGSFIWGYTSKVGFLGMMPIWQGWWIGGFSQAMLLNVPVLFLFGPMVERWKAINGLGISRNDKLSRGQLLATFVLVVGTVTGYVMLVRYFSLLQLEEALATLAFSNIALYDAVVHAFEGLSLIHWVTLLLTGTIGIFGYQAVLHWTVSLRASTQALTRLNEKLTTEITERKRAEARLTENTRALKRAIDSKDRFFSIIAHDLRSPLGSLRGLSRIITDDFDDMDRASLKKDFSLLHGSVENLYELLDNLLTWARLQTGGMVHTPEWFDLHALVQSVTELLEAHAAEKKLHFHINVPPALHTWADANMIRSVVLNLCSNAIKFTGSGGAVVFTVRAAADRLHVYVRDTGIGMTEAQLSRLFGVDTAYSTPGTANEKGSGLGLILCKEMLAFHGVELAVASRPDVGTTFTFSLPAHQPASPEIPRRQSTDARRRPLSSPSTA